MERGQKEFVHPASLTKVLVVMMWTYLSLTFVCLILNLADSYFLYVFRFGLDYNEAVYDAVYEASEISTLVQALSLIATAIVFLRWLHRCHCNLPYLGAEGMTYDPRFVGIWYFIPILNYYRPYFGMKELWQASRVPRNKEWQKLPVTWFLPLWWFFWLVAEVLSWMLILMVNDEFEEIEDFEYHNQLLLGSDIATTIFTLCVVRLILDISRNQVGHYEHQQLKKREAH